MAIGYLACCQAGQISLDGSFGTSGALNGPNYQIPASVGKTVGHNLFHSFGTFDLTQGETATFAGPTTIRNVLSRVTSGNASSIDGTIRCTIPDANFYFLNPNGVFFGPNASVEVSGSFVVTTANHVKLADGGRFDATSTADDLLTSAPPVAFGFLGPRPSSITLQGPGGSDPSLLASLVEGKTIAMIGGEIRIVNHALIAPGGRVALVAVGSSGEVRFDPEDLTSQVDLSSFQQLGNIELDDQTLIDVSANGSGKVVIQSRNLTVKNNSFVFADTLGTDDGSGIEVHAQDSIVLLNGAFLESGAFDAGRGGDIFLTARSIHINGQSDTGGVGGTGLSAGTIGTGRSGDIVIEANSFVIENGASVQASSSGTGDSGDIHLTASVVRLDAHGFSAVIGADAFFEGRCGNIFVEADRLEIENQGQITAQTHGPSTGGNVAVVTDLLAIQSGGEITVSTDGPGAGGNLSLTASAIHIKGTSDPLFPTGLSATTRGGDFGSGGRGGNIVVQPGADSMLVLELVDEGRISTTSRIGGGDAGSIEIAATTLTLGNQSSIQSSALGDAKAGSISLQATDSATLENGSSIAVSAAHGDAGLIAVNAGSQITLDHSRITAEAANDGGGIELRTGTRFYALDSQITASAGNNGGNVTIDPRFVVLNGSEVTARAVQGNGGDINIAADFFFDSSSLVDASSDFGLQGNVDITAPDVDLSGSLVGLTTELTEAESLLRPSCAVRIPGGASSFVILGRGGVPANPEGLLPAMRGVGGSDNVK